MTVHISLGHVTACGVSLEELSKIDPFGATVNIGVWSCQPTVVAADRLTDQSTCPPCRFIYHTKIRPTIAKSDPNLLRGS